MYTEMKTSYKPAEELDTLVAVALDAVTRDGTKIDPRWKSIDGVIPDSMLHEYDDKDVLRVAVRYGFIVWKCPTDRSFKANGKWIEVDRDTADEISRQGNLNHATCDRCYSSYSIRRSKKTEFY